MSIDSLLAPVDAPVKKSLILAGGGVRLAYQGGVLRALQEAGQQFVHVDGTSGGIFNTGMLASGLEPDEIAGRWRSLKLRHFVSALGLKSYLKPWQMTGLGDADGIRNHVFPSLGIDLDKIRKNKRINATFNVCNFSHKTVEAIPHHRVTEDHLIAGVSLPIFMPALIIDGHWYTDAVWIKDANLLEAVQRGADELWLVWAIGNTRTYQPGSFNQYVHMIEISANGALLEEYKQIAYINEAIVKGHAPYGQRRPVRLFVIKPDYPLPLDPDLFLGKIDTRSLINMGYADAKRCLAAMPPDGVPMDHTTTRMREPGHRLNFRGTFEGTLSWQGVRTTLTLYTYFSYHDIGGRYVLNMYASLHAPVLGREMSLYDLTISAHKVGKYQVLTATGRADHAGTTYRVHMTWRLYSPVDFLLGLEFKRAQIAIHLDESTVIKGTLYQSIRNRLRGWFTTGVATEQGGMGGLKKRYHMMLKLLTHEI
ncbi:patatin-like phospholipase family protein [Dawidia soli]|uniref:Patatin-like phospholipase family protein n=1 Tax=Dawidia soli TaxID=2782352 RepID=A0AAP2GC81_9BACT|nr:patatin-like phospholipase family protein [Dawidia soli]MBT1686014.1 patatin-like phospholipase family protein [Dawidia soli]